MIFTSTEKKIYLIALCLVLLYLIVVYHGGADSYLLIHDNLDSNVVKCKLLRLDGYFIPKTPVSHPFHGLSGVKAPTGFRFHFGSFSHAILPTLFAYILNEIVWRVMAFFGMLLLLRKHVITGENRFKPYICAGVSLAFALLPFWPTGYFNIAGQPLLLFAFLNLRKGERRLSNWLIICLFPFYSSLVLAGFAICFLLAAILVYDIVRTKKIDWTFLGALAALSAIYLLANNTLIFRFFIQSDFVSHRSEITAVKTLTLRQGLEKGWDNFLRGQYHAASLHTYFILPSCLLAILLFFRRPGKIRYVILLVISCGAVSLFYGFWFYLKPHLPDLILLRAFQWQRFHYLHPLLWFLAFALSLDIISRSWKGLFPLVLLLMIGQAAFCVYRSDPVHEKYLEKNGMTYREFYSPNLFGEIRDYIGRPRDSYRVVSIGMHPGIALFNGFYTLDGYFASYPLSYKHEFRKIIAGELRKNKRFRDYFDNWGSRCYVFASELLEKGNAWQGTLIKKNLNLKIRDLRLDTQQMRKMGGEYVFSAVEIKNAAANRLKLLEVFERNDSPWRVFLYKVDGEGLFDFAQDRR